METVFGEKLIKNVPATPEQIAKYD